MTRFYAADEKCSECRGTGNEGFPAQETGAECPRCNGVGLEPYEFVQEGWKDGPGSLRGIYDAGPVKSPEFVAPVGWEPVGRMEKVS